MGYWDASNYSDFGTPDFGSDTSSAYDASNYSDDFQFDTSWDDSFDDEFFSNDYGSDSTDQFVSDYGNFDSGNYLDTASSIDIPSNSSDVQPYTESKNNWFSGAMDKLGDFAGTDLGKQVIAGGISGLGTVIMQSMNENAAEKRAREARDAQMLRDKLQREHELKLKAMKSGGGGGPGPATTKATTSSLDQNIIRAR